MKTIGVLLAGCGHLDGSEIRESVLTLLSLDKFQQTEQKKFQIKIFAPDQNQHHVINHGKQQETTEIRNMLTEAARIARGNILPIEQINAEDLDGMIIPGGFGAAKNLCNWAFKGSAGSVQPQVRDLILALSQQQKPIGAICIAPAILALVLGSKKIRITIGTDLQTAQEIEKTGAVHEQTRTHECCVDEKNLLYTTQAYMNDQANLFEISQGIEKVVYQVMKQVMGRSL